MDRSSACIALVVCILVSCWGCSADEPKFGLEFNAKRKKIGLPELPVSWKLLKNEKDFEGRYYETYLNPHVNDGKHRPLLFKKTVKCDGDSLFYESNVYHNGKKYETLDGESVVALYFYYYFKRGKEGNKICKPGWNIKYYFGEDQTKELTLTAGDSLLRTWGLSRQ